MLATLLPPRTRRGSSRHRGHPARRSVFSLSDRVEGGPVYRASRQEILSNKRSRVPSRPSSIHYPILQRFFAYRRTYRPIEQGASDADFARSTLTSIAIAVMALLMGHNCDLR